MLKIDPISTPETNTVAFRSKVTSNKLAAEKLSRFEQASVEQFKRAISKPVALLSKNVQLANDYLAKEAAKVTSSKLKAEKMAKFVDSL